MKHVRIKNGKQRNSETATHSIQVWYIYLHLVVFYGKCIGKYTIHGWEGLTAPWFLSSTIRCQLSVHVFFTQDISLIFVWEFFKHNTQLALFLLGGEEFPLPCVTKSQHPWNKDGVFLSKEIQEFVKVLRHSSDMNHKTLLRIQDWMESWICFFWCLTWSTLNSIVKSIYHLYTILPPVCQWPCIDGLDSGSFTGGSWLRCWRLRWASRGLVHGRDLWWWIMSDWYENCRIRIPTTPQSKQFSMDLLVNLPSQY